jgi:diaminopimelate decarboxylase
MEDRLSDDRIAGAFRAALGRKDLISSGDTALLFYDLSFLDRRVKNLIEVFPESTLHAVAIKANPLVKILNHLRDIGAGLEAASLPELFLAVKCGFNPKKIVFDSPVKTRDEIFFAVENGVHINADSFDELERIDSLVRERKTASTFGVRINPQVGTGEIIATGVAGDYSKFGIPIKDHREKIIRSIIDFDWLRGIHVHIGSQGCPVNLLIGGIQTIVELVNEANSALRDSGIERRINIIDLGGGLPVSYRKDQKPVGMIEYRERLNAVLDALEGDDFKFITEFGRYIHANTGWTASRVEYVKRENGINTAMIHVGADLFLRECYRPEDWYHEFSVVDKDGNLKSGLDDTPYVLAGPLCFAGDTIARNIRLPMVEKGDYIIIHDTGAYTLSMWSRYNSRQIPKVIGYYNDGESFEILRERESADDLWKFWS